MRNECQQVPTLLCFLATGRNTLGPTMLRVVGQQCCVRLYGPLEIINNKLINKINEPFQSLQCGFKIKVSNFSCSHSFTQN